MGLPKELFIPLRDVMIEKTGLLSRAWLDFFSYLKKIIDPLGVEKSFTLLNNQVAPTKITGLILDKDSIRQAVADYLIQRITSTTELIESGILIFTYRPTAKDWRITTTEQNRPDDSGVDFNIIPEPFTATYDFTTGTWSKNSFQLIDGVGLKLTTTGALPAGYAVGTTYYVINAAVNSFKLSATIGGPAVVANTNNGTGSHTVNPNYPSGQVMYKSTNVGGTAQTFKISLRIKTLSGGNLVA